MNDKERPMEGAHAKILVVVAANRTANKNLSVQKGRRTDKKEGMKKKGKSINFFHY
ncbi:MAG: hypothetical protein GF308_02915 [Candidatus Heimdallarchaeota archaeon]|nr:hypothetical protein [Candidatus Heimdallarchaeota archaeon]